MMVAINNQRGKICHGSINSTIYCILYILIFWYLIAELRRVGGESHTSQSGYILPLNFAML